ncbi:MULTISPECIES: outer membrane protein [unclassified Legionella]|uniref:outer membrane protein n=1 Tax=unclassified Legionella TaxID=2622702 RepID=UPI00105665E7|nr:MULTISPECIES: outer membrane beta-barrel protein [unclassified Legionella]MDI9818975.1 outer membrane beta-barrel protein [Legionella sp. PL877]
MHKNIAVVLVGCSIFWSAIVSAGQMGRYGQSEGWPLVVTLSGGPAWLHGEKRQTLWLSPEIVKTYTVKDNDNTLWAAELFLGYNGQLSSMIQGQLGLAIAGISSATLKGDIWDDAEPLFDNFTYSYKVRHAHLAVKAKLLADVGYNFLPYVSGSLGFASNRASNFRNDPKIFEAIAMPAFKNKTTSSAAYTAGVGIEMPFSTNWRAGIGYEFTDWGKVKLGLAPGQTTNSLLTSNSLYTQQFQLSLSYLA